MSEELTYEKAIKRLDEIVQSLEKNETPLDESIALYEEGIRLAVFCGDKLKNAKQKITEINKD